MKLAAEPAKQNRFMKRLEDAIKQAEELKKRLQPAAPADDESVSDRREERRQSRREREE